VGHDWGSPIVSTAARLRPDVFSAVALLSVAYDPRNEQRPSEVFRAIGGDEEFYIEYFQEPGRAESEIARDPARWLEGFYFSASGDCPPLAAGEKAMGFVAPGKELLERMQFPEEPLEWMTADDLAFYVEEFARTGFTGGLNRYRCMDLDWLDLRAWHGASLYQPSLYIGGERDGPTLWGAASISRYPQTLPNLHSSVILPGVGHWMQQEDPEGVNAALRNFLALLR
jgi:pimeloyl-ACP methyl ester carboxylesterase